VNERKREQCGAVGARSGPRAPCSWPGGDRAGHDRAGPDTRRSHHVTCRLVAAASSNGRRSGTVGVLRVAGRWVGRRPVSNCGPDIDKILLCFLVALSPGWTAYAVVLTPIAQRSASEDLLACPGRKPARMKTSSSAGSSPMGNQLPLRASCSAVLSQTLRTKRCS
jgi:hypothetical protein